MILDTSIVLEKVRRKEEINENVTSVSLIEYPPLKDYKKFRGKIFFINKEDQIQAVMLQARLREIGFPMSVGDLLIAAACINRGEALLTKDKDFLVIQKVEPRLRIILKN
ncbi:MAG: DNA-binding protein [Thermoprotei archaeon]|nr:MAG: DNA-binding protein [Thermoprotei archaeon]